METSERKVRGCGESVITPHRLGNLPALQLLTPRGPGVDNGITTCCSGVANRTCDFLLSSGFLSEMVFTPGMGSSIFLAESLFIAVDPLLSPPSVLWLQSTGVFFCSSGFRATVVSDCRPSIVVDGSSKGPPRFFNAASSLCGSSQCCSAVRNVCITGTTEFSCSRGDQGLNPMFDRVTTMSISSPEKNTM